MRTLRLLTLWLLVVYGQSATALAISAVDTGWYASNGVSQPGNQNYVVGQGFDDFFGELLEYQNFFVFDLSGVADASSATLRAYLVGAPFGPGYFTPDSSESWGLFDVTTDVADLTAGIGGIAGFQDLGSGLSFGEVVVTKSDEGGYVEVILNDDAIASISAANGLWAIGGRLLTLGNGDPEVIFGFSDGNPRVELVLSTAVPAPASLLLVMTGFVALGWRSRRSARPAFSVARRNS